MEDVVSWFGRGGMLFSIILEPPWRWVTTLVLVSAICAVTDMAVRSHPRLRSHHPAYTLLFWILPTLLIMQAVVSIPLFASGRWSVVGVLASGAMVGLVVFCEYHTIDVQDKIYGVSRFILNATVYVLAFAFYIYIHQLEMGALPSALLAWLVSSLLAVELFREERRSGSIALYAAITGLTIGETEGALTYWSMAGVTGGVFLLLVFYFVTGVIQHYFSGELRRGRVLEFAAVTLVGFALVYVSRLWVV